MGSSCDNHRSTKACLESYVNSINRDKYEVVGTTGAWIKAVEKDTNRPCVCYLKMWKDERGFVWYKPICDSSFPYYVSQNAARWLKKAYKEAGLTPEGRTKDWLDFCDKQAEDAKAQKDKLATFAKSLVVGKRYPVKHDFQAGPYKFKVGDEFVFWGTLPKSKKRLSFHHDNIPVNFLLTVDLFIE